MKLNLKDVIYTVLIAFCLISVYGVYTEKSNPVFDKIVTIMSLGSDSHPDFKDVSRRQGIVNAYKAEEDFKRLIVEFKIHKNRLDKIIREGGSISCSNEYSVVLFNNEYANAAFSTPERLVAMRMLLEALKKCK